MVTGVCTGSGDGHGGCGERPCSAGQSQGKVEIVFLSSSLPELTPVFFCVFLAVQGSVLLSSLAHLPQSHPIRFRYNHLRDLVVSLRSFLSVFDR